MRTREVAPVALAAPVEQVCPAYLAYQEFLVYLVYLAALVEQVYQVSQEFLGYLVSQA